MAKTITLKDIFGELKKRGVIDIKQSNKILSEFNDIILTTLAHKEKVTLNGLLTLEPTGPKTYTGSMNGKAYTKTVENYIKVKKLSALKK